MLFRAKGAGEFADPLPEVCAAGIRQQGFQRRAQVSSGIHFLRCVPQGYDSKASSEGRR